MRNVVLKFKNIYIYILVILFQVTKNIFMVLFLVNNNNLAETSVFLNSMWNCVTPGFDTLWVERLIIFIKS